MRDEKHFSARKRASAASALQRAAKFAPKGVGLWGQAQTTPIWGGLSRCQKGGCVVQCRHETTEYFIVLYTAVFALLVSYFRG